MNTFKFSALLALLVVLSVTGISQNLPINITTGIPGYPTRTFELKTDKNLWETTDRTEKQLGNDHFKNISYDITEVSYIQCTRENGTVTAYDLGENKFLDVLQTLPCNGKTYTLGADRKIRETSSNTVIGDNAGVLRNENNILVKVNKSDGVLYRYKGNPNNWERINQIVTLLGTSYAVKTDNSVYMIAPDISLDTILGTNCKLILSNEKNVSAHLTILSTDGKHLIYDREKKIWSVFNPRTIALSPTMVDPGIWFVIQNKAALDDKNLALKADDNGVLTLAAIPNTGPFDEFLWRVDRQKDGSLVVVNKKLGNGKTMTDNQGTPAVLQRGHASWIFTVANKNVHGTNAYTIASKSGKVLANRNNTAELATGNGSAQQVWVIQPMDLVNGYRLPSKNGTEQYAEYNKILKIEGGPTIYGTNTVSDWSVLNAYNVVQNMLNALKDQAKLAASVVHSQKIVVIGKDDTYPATANYPIIAGNKIVAFFRGLNAGTAYTVFTEEMMCMNGVVNRYGDFGERRFDHITHEYGHGLDALMNWDGSNTIGDSKTSAWLNSLKVELVPIAIQAWFDCNYPGSYSGFPQTRSGLQSQEGGNNSPYSFVEERFNVTNTWKPPYRLRMYPQTNTVANQEIKNITSINGQYRLTMKSDGNLCLYNISGGGEQEVWSSKTAGKGGVRCVMQRNGNLVIQDNGGREVWSTKTQGNYGAYLSVNDNGTIGVYWENPKANIWESCYPMSPHFVDGEIYQIEGVGSYAGKFWTVTGVGTDDQLAFRPLPANPTEADVQKTQFKVIVLSQKRRAIVFESISNPGYFLYPIRPAGKPWIVGTKRTNLNSIKTDTDGHFILGYGITRDPADFSINPRMNQAWVMGCGFPGGIGMHMPGVFGYKYFPESHWKGAFRSVPKNK